ncbi:MAG: hypothetical protein OXN25_10310, partial [Candidatus Poribacteria bacterium]|nr:hypothetical protein [Candidatus Poribacteria bacterium]
EGDWVPLLSFHYFTENPPKNKNTYPGIRIRILPFEPNLLLGLPPQQYFEVVKLPNFIMG